MRHLEALAPLRPGFRALANPRLNDPIAVQLLSAHAPGDRVTLDAIEAGIGLARWAARDWQRVFHAMLHGAGQDDDAALRRWIEARGGFRQAREHIIEQIDKIRVRRAEDIAHRRTAVTGVSEFPELTEPLPRPPDPPDRLWRNAAAFEELRDRSDAQHRRTGERPRVLLLPLGPLAENNVRTSFVVNLLAAGGIEAVNPGTVEPGGVAGAVRDCGAAVVVICGSDPRYGTEAAEIVDAARSAGVRRVYLAGSKAAIESAPEGSRPDDYLNAKIDVVKALSVLLDGLDA
jgi:methylmalonyl-CoA mutase